MMSNIKKYSKAYRYRQIKKKIETSLYLTDLDSKASTSFLKQIVPYKSNTDEKRVLDDNVAESFHESPIGNIETDPMDFGNSDDDSPVSNLPGDESVSEDNNKVSSTEVPPETVTKNESAVSSTTFLKNWSIKNNITHSALTELLNWCKTKPDLLGLPQCARTILQTPTHVRIEIQGCGKFFYFGLKAKLQKIMLNFCEYNKVYLDFGVDGLPLHKSTKLSFWPILCKISNLPLSPVFTVAIFCGSEKPPLNEFFQKFVEELLHLKTSGLVCNDKIVKVISRAFCCDTPARAFIKNTKAHNGYQGCDKCQVRGIYVNRKMLFEDLSASCRTDGNFRMRVDENHHKGSSPLELLEIGMVTSFPIDYMHCVCLGVMRKLLFLWRDGSQLYRITGDALLRFENCMKLLQNCWPTEFNRKPRSIKDLERWKATEFRQFLLYVGPVLLKNILPPHVYANFMLLKYAITILLNENLNSDHNDYANSLLRIFVKHAAHIYGRDFCVYNSHVLIHLAAEAKEYGSLDTISCFPYENHLQILKKMLRKPNLPLQQVVRRIYERGDDHDWFNYIEKAGIHVLGNPVKQKDFIRSNRFIRKYKNYELYQKLYFNGKFLLSNKAPNDIVMLKCSQIMQCCYFIQVTNSEVIIIGRKCDIVKPFAEYPADSSVISLFEIELNDRSFTEFSAHNISCKGVMMQCDDKIVFSPLTHLL